MHESAPERDSGQGIPAHRREVKPYVPADVQMPELTVKAVVVGVVLAAVLGAANAYLGLKAGLTVSATFPAAVLALAIFRIPRFRGTILEQNLARTTASVGEALVAGAIFTLPAFVIARVDGEPLWRHFNYWESSAILLVGGLLGVLFVILLRRTLVVDADLPFPEAFATYEIVRTGQKGESGAKYVFGALGLGALIEMFKNSSGIPIFKEAVETFIRFPASTIRHFNPDREPLGAVTHTGGIAVASPAASPALLGVGYIIGPRLAAINFCGGLLAWGVLIPLGLFLNPNLQAELSTAANPVVPWEDLAYTVWYNQVRPLAVGAMLVGSLYTLWGLRGSIFSAFRGAFGKAEGGEAPNRLEKDINLRWILGLTVVIILPITGLYYYFTQNLLGALIAALIMTVTGFLFAGVGGWLVGLVGGSNQPISGLALSTLIVAALVMLAIGVSGSPGVAAVLAVAAVVCCATSMSGDMIQDLKVGQLIGGTPWRMEIAEVIGTVVVSFVLIFPIIWLHEADIARGGLGIGGEDLAAPQAGLMAQLATGIVGGEMAWGLILIGALFAVALILIKAPAPMLIAVGMYLPLDTTFAIFIGGLIRALADRYIARRTADPEAQARAENRGTLVASGFVAGEALAGVLFAILALTLGADATLGGWIPGLEGFTETFGGWASILIFLVVGWFLVKVPLSAVDES